MIDQMELGRTGSGYGSKLSTRQEVNVEVEFVCSSVKC